MPTLIVLSVLIALCLVQPDVATDIPFPTDAPIASPDDLLTEDKDPSTTPENFTDPDEGNLDAPFDPSLVGKVFTFRIGGLRFPRFARLEIKQTLLAYFPAYSSSLPGGTLDTDCYPSIQLLLNEDVNLLKVIRYSQNSPGCNCISPFFNVEFDCSFPNEEFVPNGPTGEDFQLNVKLIFQAASVMRDRRGGECFLRPPEQCDPIIPRPELDGILNYLNAVGDSLGFRVDDLDPSFNTIGR